MTRKSMRREYSFEHIVNSHMDKTYKSLRDEMAGQIGWNSDEMERVICEMMPQRVNSDLGCDFQASVIDQFSKSNMLEFSATSMHTMAMITAQNARINGDKLEKYQELVLVSALYFIRASMRTFESLDEDDVVACQKDNVDVGR